MDPGAVEVSIRFRVPLRGFPKLRTTQSGMLPEWADGFFLRCGSGLKFGLSRGVPPALCYKPCRGQVVSYLCRAATLNPIFLVGFCKGLG